MNLAKTLALSLVLLAAACTPKDQPGQADGSMVTTGSAMPSASMMAATSASAAPSAEPASAANDPLPSHGDVAKKVRGEISKTNYKTELDKLEKEIE